MSSVILGDWTHRRGDPGGARAVAAEIDRPRPEVAWLWRPEHAGRVDQIRVFGPNIIAVTMMPGDAAAPGWEHAVVYALDAQSGAEVARRVLADPVPVAAVFVEEGLVHVVATRKGEPIFWYALSPPDLAPQHRRVLALEAGALHDDVLDAWATPDGGLWLELDAAPVDDRKRRLMYVFADAGGATHAISTREGCAGNDGLCAARDACGGGHELFAPVDGRWIGDEAPLPPGLARLEPRSPARQDGEPWVSANLVGPGARIHAVGGDGVVCAVAAAEDPSRPERVRVEAFAVDRLSGVVRWRAHGDRIATRSPLGDAARVARRPNGELLFQSLGPDAAPRTPLVCARPDGRVDEILLGARGRWVLDASLGDLVLAHREDTDGRVQVGGFAIDQEGRLLGRRAVARWSVQTADLGGGTAVYAGAGAIVVRGSGAVCGIRL